MVKESSLNEQSCGCEHCHGNERDEIGKAKIIQTAVGAAVFAAAIALKYIVPGVPESAAGKYIVLALCAAAYLILGGEVLLRAVRNIVRGRVFDENFLMGVATLCAFAIGEYPEAVAVMLFYQIGEYFQASAVRRSKKSIAELMDIRPDYANLLKNREVVCAAPETVAVGDRIVVNPGEKIPLDGVILEGRTMLDTSALTGESVPREAEEGDAVLSGCVNQSGVITVKVTKIFGESTAAKIIDLVENAASQKAPAENFITAFSKVYTPVVVGLAVLLSVVPPLFLGGFSEWLRRGLIFLVISCPCALVVSVPLGFFGGIGGASKRGILVKGGNYLEALANLDIVVFDKTGTLTEGVFEVTDVAAEDGFTKDGVLEYAANAEAFSNHPIAQSVRGAFGREPDRENISDYTEEAGHGISALVGGKRVFAGRFEHLRDEGISCPENNAPGTKVYVAVDGVYAGCVVIADKIKADSREAVSRLKARGVRKTVMLTGDDPAIAGAVDEKLGVDEVYAGLLPGDKVEIVENLANQKQGKGKLAFVGDGINDAPALARADIGIAMGGIGSDAAIEAADAVIMTDEPSKLCEAVDIARRTKRIVTQNIVFALSVKAFFLVLGAFGLATMWAAVFADVGVSALAVLNAMRSLRGIRD